MMAGTVFQKSYDYSSQREPQASACAERPHGLKPAALIVVELMKQGTRSGVLVGMVNAVWIAGSAMGQQPPDYSGSCTRAGCHDQYQKRSVVHDAIESCDTCHETSDARKHKFTFTQKGAALCFDCHDEHEGRVKHSPAADGSCTACHDPHASEAKGLLKAKTVAGVCADCHDDTLEDLKYLHGPAAAGDCTTCHDAHASDNKALLREAERKVCVKCHTILDVRVTKAAHSHDAAKEGCISCHRPHGADNNMMLKTWKPDLCVDCHDDIGEVMDGAKVRHDALTADKGCANCHDPHGCDTEHLLLKQQMALCLSCHDRELPSGDGKVLNITKLLQENPKHHGPVADKNCCGCHTPHAGAYFRLLTKAYPDGFYAPYDEKTYALCFDCHDAELAEEAETEEATGFRNGKQNLHLVHVDKAVKGRTCGCCHNAHASRGPKFVADKVRFGEWQLPIDFTATPSGGSCSSGCHRVYAYDREKPVENIPPS